MEITEFTIEYDKKTNDKIWNVIRKINRHYNKALDTKKVLIDMLYEHIDESFHLELDEYINTDSFDNIITSESIDYYGLMRHIINHIEH